MKKLTTSQLKKKLDTIFSIYIRLLHSDNNGMASCFTCGKRAYWKELQNGHFVTRSHLATRFDKTNCKVQCVGCNVFGGGKPDVFALKLEEENPGIVLSLYRSAQRIVKDYPYTEQIAFYKERVKEIAAKKGIII